MKRPRPIFSIVISLISAASTRPSIIKKSLGGIFNPTGTLAGKIDTRLIEDGVRNLDAVRKIFEQLVSAISDPPGHSVNRLISSLSIALAGESWR